MSSDPWDRLKAERAAAYAELRAVEAPAFQAYEEAVRGDLSKEPEAWAVYWATIEPAARRRSEREERARREYEGAM